MKNAIKIEELNDIEKKICISVEPDIVNKKFTDFFDSVRKDAQINGFRRGKAPVDILKKRFEHRAKGAISQMLMSEYYQHALKNHDINPINRPSIFSTQYDANDKKNYLGIFGEDNTYSIELVVEVLPKIDPVGINDITIDKQQYDLDSLINKKMTEYQDQFAERLQIKDKPALEKDSVLIDYEGFVDGKSFDKKEGLHIDSLCFGNLVPGFESQIVGMIEGEEKEITIKFPEEYIVSALANKEAKFNIKLCSVVRKIPAPVDNDLAMMVGYESVDDLMQNITNEVNDWIKLATRNHIEENIVNELIKRNQFAVPKSMVHGEMQRLLKHYNISKPTENVISKIKEAAELNVRKAILLDAIFEKEGLEIAPEDLKQYLDKEAKSVGKTTDELVSTLYNTNQMDSFVSIVRTHKTIEHLMNLNTKNNND